MSVRLTMLVAAAISVGARMLMVSGHGKHADNLQRLMHEDARKGGERVVVDPRSRRS